MTPAQAVQYPEVCHNTGSILQPTHGYKPSISYSSKDLAFKFDRSLAQKPADNKKVVPAALTLMQHNCMSMSTVEHKANTETQLDKYKVHIAGFQEAKEKLNTAIESHHRASYITRNSASTSGGNNGCAIWR